MKILANENFPRLAIEALRAAGHDVVWARTDMAGDEDHVILARAQSESRVVVTFDKDFGELAFRWGLPAECGVILMRFKLQSPAAARDRIVDVLQQRSDWTGNIAIIEESRIRIRPLPSTKEPDPSP